MISEARVVGPGFPLSLYLSAKKKTMSDFYSVLDVPKDATEEAIKKVLAKKWHPDKNHGSQDEAKFKEISEAS